MPELDAQTLLDHAELIGLISREQSYEARTDAEDGTAEAVGKSLLRKGYMTSWQLDRLKKGERGGFVFGGCKVLFHLAEGTFARVYRGQRLQGGQPVAVKVLRNRFVTEPGAIQRFNKEAEAGMKLRHPNIVQILEYGEEDRKFFMIMEYVEGSNLRELLKIRTRIDANTALPMMVGLAHGLKYSFDNGVTHRDLKGTNILVSTNGVAKLVDFGLATIESDEKKAASINPRTVDYSALERACGSPKGDFRSDIFFLGCVFYQMLTGQPAMSETETKDLLTKMLKRSFGAIKPLSGHRYAPHPELTRIIERMMKVELAARYQRIEDVIEDLERYAATKTPAAVAAAAAAAASAAESGLPEEEEEIQFDKVELFMDRTPEREPEPLAPAAVEGPVKEENSDGDDEDIPIAPLKQVLCVESQGEIQEAFRKTLTKMGYRVLLVGDAGHAAERYGETRPDGVIFDADGFGSESVGLIFEMYDKAHEIGRELTALILLGPKQAAFREQLPTDDRLVVLSKPVKMKQVQDAIAQLVPAG